MILSGWGNHPRVDVRLLRARGEDEIRASIETNVSMIARGNGRAYGDAALNRAATLSLLPSDRILAFDAETGLLTCEAGLLLRDMLELFVPRGWFSPVTPGTKFVTIGGMIAVNVHGKNHHGAGSISNHIENLTLVLADGRVVACSKTANADLFAATCGGMGLTGIVVTATLRMKQIKTAYIRQKTLRAANLHEAMSAFESSGNWTYSVAWIDCLARGNSLGRSLVYLGEHAEPGELKNVVGDPFRIGRRLSYRVPFNFPDFVLNRWSASAFNHIYYALGREGTGIVDYETFFYPLDALLEWNRIYGRRGFVQYQCVLPKTASAEGLPLLLSRIAQSGQSPFLAVLKLLGGGNGFLDFVMEGYTLALDFPASTQALQLLAELDAIVADHGGRIYLAKDARMEKSMVRAGYHGLGDFLALRRQIDPQGKFSSLLSARLGL